MKALPLVLLNLAVVGVALVAYDQLRAEPEPPAAAAPTADTEALEARLDALEGAQRRGRRGGAFEASVLERLGALEEAVQAALAAPAPAAAPTTAAAVTPPSRPRVADGEPTEAEIARFRRLQEAVHREETIRKLADRIDKQLAELPLRLSDEQRTQVHEAFADFRPRIDEIWGEAKARAQDTVAAGGEIDRATIVAETTALIQSEFAATLDGVVAPGEAEMIAASLLSRGK